MESRVLPVEWTSGERRRSELILTVEQLRALQICAEIEELLCGPVPGILFRAVAERCVPGAASPLLFLEAGLIRRAADGGYRVVGLGTEPVTERERKGEDPGMPSDAAANLVSHWLEGVRKFDEEHFLLPHKPRVVQRPREIVPGTSQPTPVLEMRRKEDAAWVTQRTDGVCVIGGQHGVILATIRHLSRTRTHWRGYAVPLIKSTVEERGFTKWTFESIYRCVHDLARWNLILLTGTYKPRYTVADEIYGLYAPNGDALVEISCDCPVDAFGDNDDPHAETRLATDAHERSQAA